MFCNRCCMQRDTVLEYRIKRRFMNIINADVRYHHEILGHPQKQCDNLVQMVVPSKMDIRRSRSSVSRIVANVERIPRILIVNNHNFSYIFSTLKERLEQVRPH